MPLSVWPATPAPGCGLEAAHAITAFSRAGELIVIPAAGTAALLSAAAAAGRRVLGLFPSPAEVCVACSRLDWDLGPERRPLAHARPAALGCCWSPVARRRAGRPGHHRAQQPRRAGGVLYAACERVLRPGGVLAVLPAATRTPAGLRDDPGEVIAAARAAGLIYTQHIIAVHAAITGGQLTPGPGEAPGPPAACARIHSDLLVFTKPGTPAGSAGLEGTAR